jgi:hypothetical protein
MDKRFALFLRHFLLALAEKNVRCARGEYGDSGISDVLRRVMSSNFVFPMPAATPTISAAWR